MKCIYRTSSRVSDLMKYVFRPCGTNKVSLPFTIPVGIFHCIYHLCGDNNVYLLSLSYLWSVFTVSEGLIEWFIWIVSWSKSDSISCNLWWRWQWGVDIMTDKDVYYSMLMWVYYCICLMLTYVIPILDTLCLVVCNRLKLDVRDFWKQTCSRSNSVLGPTHGGYRSKSVTPTMGYKCMTPIGNFPINPFPVVHG